MSDAKGGYSAMSSSLASLLGPGDTGSGPNCSRGHILYSLPLIVFVFHAICSSSKHVRQYSRAAILPSSMPPNALSDYDISYQQKVCLVTRANDAKMKDAFFIITASLLEDGCGVEHPFVFLINCADLVTIPSSVGSSPSPARYMGPLP